MNNPVPPDPPPDAAPVALAPRWRLWRSIRIAWAVTAVALIVGVPLFVRMPPWCDLTLYDLAARNLLSGGIHYRDVFDTNLPGFVWALTAIRASLGLSMEAVRAVDLVIVAAIVLLLDRLAARGGAPAWARAWAIAGAAVFYPFTSEMNHCQRDVWMTLPAAAAVLLRVRRLSVGGGAFRWGVIEGALWGLAVWVKPHAAVPALVVWLATVRWVAARGGRRAIAADLAGNVFGGLLVGAAGISYLVWSGTWPHLVEVFTVWNTGYMRQTFGQWLPRLGLQLSYFPPWSYLQLLSVPFAVADIRRGFIRSDNGQDSIKLGRLALAALYLGWTGQALLFQREFHYVHVPETLMLLAYLASRGWAAGAFGVGWLVASSLVVLAGVPDGSPPPGRPDIRPLPRLALRHPAFDMDRMRHWDDCWRTDLGPDEWRKRRNDLRLISAYPAANDWVQLGEVVDWLAARGVADGDVMAWHDTPHAVCVELGVRPGFRFQHVRQMSCIGPVQAAAIQRELCGTVGRVRYVVSDLTIPWAFEDDWVGGFDSAGPDLYPTEMPAEVRRQFPYQQPAVFRSGGGHGRYIVHELRQPIPDCEK